MVYLKRKDSKPENQIKPQVNVHEDDPKFISVSFISVCYLEITSGRSLIEGMQLNS